MTELLPPAFVVYFSAVILSEYIFIVESSHLLAWSSNANRIVFSSLTFIEKLSCSSSLQNPEAVIIGDDVTPQPVADASTYMFSFGSGTLIV
jgi:hypothetical protein